MEFRVDNLQPIAATLREIKLTIDPRFRGELEPHYQRPGIRRHYFDAKRGATIDEMGEILWSRGYLTDRPSERDLLDLLDNYFHHVADSRESSRTVASEENAYGRAMEQELQRARKNRYRAWTCSCGETLIRSGRLNLRLTCGYCEGPVYRTERTVSEILSDVPLSTIQSSDYRPPASTPF